MSMTPITFTRTLPGTYDATTDTWSAPTVTTIPGRAFAKPHGIPDRYAALGLTLARAITLVFSPSAYPLLAHTPEFVLPGDTTVWNGLTLTARDIDPVAIDGTVKLAYIIVEV